MPRGRRNVEPAEDTDVSEAETPDTKPDEEKPSKVAAHKLVACEVYNARSGELIRAYTRAEHGVECEKLAEGFAGKEPDRTVKKIYE